MKPSASHPIPFPPVASAFILAVALVACGDAASPDSEVRVDTVDGVEHTVVENTAERVDDLEFLWSAPDEGTVMEGTEWADPTFVAVSEEHIAVLDPRLARVHLFTPDGERAGSFGRQGEGPGEISNPMSIGLHGDSVLVASLMGRPPLQWFGVDGSYRGHGGGSDGGMMGSVFLLPGTGIVRQVVDIASGSAEQVWEYLDLADQRTVLERPDDHPMQPHVAEGREGCWRRGVAGPHLAEVDCTFPLVRIIEPTGRVARVHRIDRAPERTPEHLIQGMVDSMRANMRISADGVPQEMINNLIERQLESTREQYAWKPVMNRVAGSRSGHRILLLEQLPETLSAGEPSILHILSDDGRYLARHSFDRRIRSLAASDTQLVVLIEDALGLRRMEAYRLP